MMTTEFPRRIAGSLPGGRSWKLEFLSKELGTFAEAHPVQTRKRYVARGEVWMYFVLTLKQGRIRYFDGRELVEPEAERFACFLPPFSLTYREYCDAAYDVVGTWSCMPISLPDSLSMPLLFTPRSPQVPTEPSELIQMLRTGKNHRRIDRCAGAGVIARRTKALIDKTYRTPAPLPEVLQKMSRSSTWLATNFRKNLGLTPIGYRSLMRSSAAYFYIARGEKVSSVAQEVGYEDLSRFNKQAKKLSGFLPRHFKRSRSNR
jgi:AraC-like DNA-binding protein